MTSPDFNPYLAPEAKDGNAIDSGPVGPPWLTIFIRPRATIRRILDSNRTAALIPLTMSFVVAVGLPRAYLRFLDNRSWRMLLLEQAIPGAIAGLVGLFFLGYLLGRTGRWIGGKASQKDIRTAMAWSTVPFIPCLIVHLLVFVSFHLTIEGMERDGIGNRFQATILLVLMFVRIITVFWFVILWGKCVAEAHRFSWLKAIGSAILGYLTLLGVLAVIAGGAYLLGRLLNIM